MKNVYKCFSALLALGILLAASNTANAAPLEYTLSFTLNPTSLGPLPTAGSFFYDDTAAPGSAFSAFTITWDGVVFDFTNDANSVDAADATLQGCSAAGTLPMLLGECGGPLWISIASPSSSAFGIGGLFAGQLNVASQPGVPGDGTGGAGTFSALPEPSSFALFLLGTALIAVEVRRRSRLISLEPIRATRTGREGTIGAVCPSPAAN